jgi:hypothetical protein
MSKKHFIKLAGIVNQNARKAETGGGSLAFIHGANAALRDVSEAIADFCAEENPAFDRVRFLEACNVSQH